LIKRLLPRGTAPGARSTKGVFYYPRRGYGQICERLAEAAQAAGARLVLGATAVRVAIGAAGTCVEARSASGSATFPSGHLWSTIPMPVLVRLLDPPPAAEVLAAASALEMRAMLLVYLVLDADRFTEFDAHYFPEEGLPFTRLSEPKNYAALRDPRGVTVLCAEIPCARGDATWSRPDQDLGAMVKEGLARAGLPVRCRIQEVAVRRLPAAYPIYRSGYERHFARLDGHLEGLDRVLSFGRQGLYAHDNTHHALFMARAAVASFRNGVLDREAWRSYRQVFERHVVED
jgi:protoporphyrinogen oxidase